MEKTLSQKRKGMHLTQEETIFKDTEQQHKMKGEHHPEVV
jgi:hypothetical protein